MKDKGETQEILPLKNEWKYTIIGMSGSGKTTLEDFLIKHTQFSVPEVIVDPVGHYIKSEKFGVVGYYRNKLVVKIYTPKALDLLVKHFFPKPFFFWIDEADQYFPVREQIQNYFYSFRWLKEGRNFGEGGLFVAQIVGQLNKNVLTNSQMIFLFTLRNRGSIDYVTHITDITKEEILSLKRYEFLVYNQLTGEKLGVYTLKRKRELVRVR